MVDVYSIGRRWEGIHQSLLQSSKSQQIFNVYPDQYLVFFALAALLCMLNYDKTNRARWLMGCGLATGAVFLFKYNVGLLLVASGTFSHRARFV